METIVAINEDNVLKAAELSIELWPGCSLVEMTAHYRELLNEGRDTCFLLQNESQYLGFIELSVRNDYVEGAEQLPVAYIEGVFIDKAHRHKGCASLLLQRAEAWAREKGFKQICSDTELDNRESIGFHTAAGFAEAARIVCFAKNLE